MPEEKRGVLHSRLCRSGESQNPPHYVNRHLEHVGDFLGAASGLGVVEDAGLHDDARSFDNPLPAASVGDALNIGAMRPDKICHGLKTDAVEFGSVGGQAPAQIGRATLEQRRRKGVDQKGRGLALARALAHPAYVVARLKRRQARRTWSRVRLRRKTKSEDKWGVAAPELIRAAIVRLEEIRLETKGEKPSVDVLITPEGFGLSIVRPSKSEPAGRLLRLFDHTQQANPDQEGCYYSISNEFIGQYPENAAAYFEEFLNDAHAYFIENKGHDGIAVRTEPGYTGGTMGDAVHDLNALAANLGFSFEEGRRRA
jgi:hypothetical protein